MEKRPHIIIINPDEMRYDTLSHMDVNKAAYTPNLDRLVEDDAVSFSNAFCQNPVCVPSRCSFMTGLYPHTRGHRTMSYLLQPGEDSLLKELKDNGYYVWMNDRNDLTAAQIDGWTESHADEIHYYEQRRKAKGPIKELKGQVGDKLYYSHYHGELGLDEQGENYTSDDEAIDAAIERILNPVDDRPLCVFLGLFYPHVPYNIEKPYLSKIDRTKLPKRIKLEDCKDKAPILYKINELQNMKECDEEDWDNIRQTYLAMCSKVDDQVGRLIKALKDKGIYDNCAIFFISDHGDFAGDYSLVEKNQNTFEDALTRVPFIIKPPKGYKVDPGVSPAFAELVDFYATVMDMAKVTPSHTHFGRSLVPNIADRELKGRDFVTSEGGREKGEIHCDEFHQNGKDGPSIGNDYYPKMAAEKEDDLHDKGIMIRDEHFKYISRSRTKDELYDLDKDPNEMVNEIDNPKYKEVIIDMKEKLLKWLQQTADIVPYQIDSRFTKKMIWSKVQSLCPEEEKETILKMIDKGMPFGAIIYQCIQLRKKYEK